MERKSISSPESGAAADPGDARRVFGPTGREVARVGQGTWQMERNPREAARALRHGVALGASHVDTAELYGGGEVETIVGEALHGIRQQAYLVSKVDPAAATRNGLPRACEGSLRRLRTDYLDLYLLHWLPPHPLEESVAGLEGLVAAGKICNWGVSNFDELRLAELLRIVGPNRIVCNQIMHHLGQRSVEHAVVPFCQRHGIAVVGYSPFGAGAFPPRSRLGAADVLEQVARSLRATARQTALAFLLHHSGGFTIPKASRIEHVEENAAAAALCLPTEALEELGEAFPLGEPVGGVPLW